jgi:hypothetical protein
MKTIRIRSIPHESHRLEAGDTVGDWYEDVAKVIHIEVSEMSDTRYELLVAIHELIEKVLCDDAAIDEKEVDKFDSNWKEHDGIDEAGNDPDAPYHYQHKMADVVERLVALGLNVDWNKYNDEVMSF